MSIVKTTKPGQCRICFGELPEKLDSRGRPRKTCSYKCRNILRIQTNPERYKRVQRLSWLKRRKDYFEKRLEKIKKELEELESGS